MMKRTTYAQRFAASLEIATGEVGTYRCPLCLTAYPVSDADQLTWDHYPPRSIGGRRADAVLVCSHCRGKWDRVDAELDRVKRRSEFNEQYPNSIPFILNIPDYPSVRGLRHRVAMDIKPGSIRVIGRAEENPRDATERLNDFLSEITAENKWDGLKINFESDPGLVCRRRHVELAFFKAAYLAAFNYFGYPYIFSPAVNSLRLQMHEPDVTSVSGHTLMFTPQPSEIRCGVFLAVVRSPRSLTGLAVFFLGYKLREWCITFLPVPSMQGLPEYGKLEEALKAAGYMEHLFFDRHREMIVDPEIVFVDREGKEFLPMYPRA